MKKIVLSLLSLSLLSGCTGTGRFDLNVAHGTHTEKRAGSAVSRGGAGNSAVDPADAVISQRIRQSIMGDPLMSVNAQNIGIVTVRRHVTISGAVDDPAEQNRVLAKIKAISGLSSITNALEVLDKDAETDARSAK